MFQPLDVRRQTCCAAPVSTPISTAREAYDAWHGSHGVESSSDTPWHNQVKQALGRLGGVKDRRILEIGCGRGGFALWLASQTPRPGAVVAADFSARAVELAEQSARESHVAGIDWEVQDIQSIGHPDASFDIVVSCETIEHVPSPRTAIIELNRVLKPGGLFLLTHPNYLSTIGLYRLSLRLRGRKYTEEGQPINHPLWTFQVRRWLRAAGFRLEPLTATGNYLVWPGRLPVESRWLSRPRWLMRWFAFHPLHIAVKVER
jgi:SAM-dependent methyltransferase